MLSALAPPLCVACGAFAGRAAPLCRDCRAGMGQPPFPYEGPAGAMVRALKFGGRRAIADVMAAQLVAALHPPSDAHPRIGTHPAGAAHPAIVPVPVHPAHRRRRGIDHSLWLARAVARRTGWPLADCLVRRGDPRPQVGRGRRARMLGPVGSVELRAGSQVPRVAVIVDDVVTTGATLAACADTLRSGGAERISALVYARTSAR